MEDPKPLPSCVRILETISKTLEQLYKEAGRGKQSRKVYTCNVINYV